MKALSASVMERLADLDHDPVKALVELDRQLASSGDDENLRISINAHLLRFSRPPFKPIESEHRDTQVVIQIQHFGLAGADEKPVKGKVVHDVQVARF